MNPTTKRGFLYAIKDLIREQGATRLDAFASSNQNLEEIYKKTLGFKTASIMEYNMDYNHDDIAENHGNPDVIFMVAEGTPEQRHFTKDQYDEAEAYQKAFAQNKQSHEENSIFYSLVPDSERRVLEAPGIVTRQQAEADSTGYVFMWDVLRESARGSIAAGASVITIYHSKIHFILAQKQNLFLILPMLGVSLQRDNDENNRPHIIDSFAVDALIHRGDDCRFSHSPQCHQGPCASIGGAIE